ncbi:MAG: GspE/PulE/PilB domain-containing protein, partial [Caldimonas sp.]
MNPATSDPATAVAPRVLDAALVREAQRSAGSRPALEWLAEQLGLGEEALLPIAARYFGLRPLDMVGLRAIKPDFAIASFADCKRRGCLVGSLDAGRLTVVIANPIDARLRRWIEVRTQGRAVDFALTTRADLLAFLVTAEKSVRAMDAVRLQQGRAANAEAGVSISIAGIDATESPIVR